MFMDWRIVATLCLAISLAGDGFGQTTVVFDDGRRHMITDSEGWFWTDQKLVSVSNGSHLDIAAIIRSDAGYPFLQVESASVDVLPGGTIHGAGLNAGGVHLLATSTLRVSGTEVEINADIGDEPWVALQAYDDSRVEQTAGTIFAMDLFDRAHLEMTGGMIDFRRFRPALHASGMSTARIAGGTLQTSWESGRTLQLSEQAHVVIENASIRGSSQFGNIDLVLAEGNSILELHDTQVSARYSQGVDVGEFYSGLVATGKAHVTIDGGAFDLDFDGPPKANIIDAREQSHVEIRGGRFDLEYFAPLGAFTASVNAISAAGDSVVEIHGGEWKLVDLAATNEPVILHHINAAETSTVRLFGSDFNFPLNEPIEATEGTITGVLSDGSPIEFDFVRREGATIVLVPEPSALAMLGTLLIGICFFRRLARV